MKLSVAASRKFGLLAILLAGMPALWLGDPVSSAPPTTLHIGWSGSLIGGELGKREKAGLDSLQTLIKEETGLANDITYTKGWRELTERMAKGDFQLGMFPGYEFAWAQEKYPKLKPLALAINTHRYPVACIVVRKDSKIADFAGLQGKELGLSTTEPAHVRLYVNRLVEAAGKQPDKYFSKIARYDNSEDPLDDTVDDKIQACALDRVSLEAFRRRKPGRFNQLKELVHSRPFPPPLLGYLDGSLDTKSLMQFRDGLINAHRKEKGQTLLTLYRLTGFEAVPKDLDKVLTETHKAYPPELPGKSK